MFVTVPSTKKGTQNYGNENYGRKDLFPKIFSDFQQEWQFQMPEGANETLELNQPGFCLHVKHNCVIFSATQN